MPGLFVQRTSNGAMHDRPVLELDCHRFVVQFHQKPAMNGLARRLHDGRYA